MFSVGAQDHYLYTTHFIHMSRPGVYLDIAANHAVHGSNTLFFDSCLSWSGMCVEPDPKYLDGLNKFRSCVVLPTCVSDVDGEVVNFIFGGKLGGIADSNKNVGNLLTDSRARNTREITCRSMTKALGNTDSVIIDYLSLDVEGHEVFVLKGFNWNNTRFNVITIEVSETTTPLIEAFLVSKGYVRHFPALTKFMRTTGRLHLDAVFLHNSVTFGSPE